MIRVMCALLFAGWCVLWTVSSGPSSHAVAAEPTLVSKSAEFFPDAVGNRWTYTGRVTSGPIQQIAAKHFQNISTVTGTETMQGVQVTVFHDTNPGDHGAQDSFYRRDAAGIVYYGSRPGTDLERQVIPYQIVRFPITIPSSFQQFDRKDLDFGADLDGDRVNERADLAATVTVKELEDVSVPAGAYKQVLRVEAKMTIHIHLTKLKRVATGTDNMTAWFARGVGLIKYVERQQLPGIRTDQDRTTEITEELVEVTLNGQVASRGGRKAAAGRVFADGLGGHELGQVVLAAGLGAHAGETMPAERLPAHERAGDRAVDVEVADVEGPPRRLDVPRAP